METAAAADPNAPHPHQGIIPKFIDPSPALISPEEKETLVSGKPVYQQTKHDYQPNKGAMTWTLDYNRKSDLNDSAGHWLVYTSPADTAKTRVEYSVALIIGPAIPSFIETILTDKGIKNATNWVKKNAEKSASP